ncbi:hypothetical protein D6817_04500, partial [Candidatus Pacearchaeota archaeon]
IVQDTQNPTWSGQNQSTSPIGQGETINLWATWNDNYNLNEVWLATNETGTWKNYTARRAGLTLNDFAETSKLAVDQISATASLFEVEGGYVRDAINLSYDYDSGFADDTFDVVVNISVTNFTKYDNVSYYVFADVANRHRTSILVANGSTVCTATTPVTLASTGWQKVTFNVADIGGSCNKEKIDLVRIRFSDEVDTITGTGNITLDEFYLTSDKLRTVVSNFTWQNSSISGGFVSWRIYMNDSAGNLNATEIMTFEVRDIVNPTWSNNKTSPASPVTYSPTQTYQFNVTWTDNVAIETVLIENNFSGGALKNDTVTTHNGDEYYFDVSTLAVGTYQWRMIANDTSGNANQTDIYTYTVNKAASEVNLTLDGNDANVTVEVHTNVNLTAYRLQGEGVIKLYLDGNLINQGSGTLENLTDFNNTGTFNVTVIYEATQNYTSSSETHYV